MSYPSTNAKNAGRVTLQKKPNQWREKFSMIHLDGAVLAPSPRTIRFTAFLLTPWHSATLHHQTRLPLPARCPYPALMRFNIPTTSRRHRARFLPVNLKLRVQEQNLIGLHHSYRPWLHISTPQQVRSSAELNKAWQSCEHCRQLPLPPHQDRQTFLPERGLKFSNAPSAT